MKVKLSMILGIIGVFFISFFLIKEPLFLLYFLLWSLPGILLTYNFNIELTFLERFSISLAISNIFLILFRILTTLKIPFGKNKIFMISFILPIIISLINYKFFIKQIKGFKFEKVAHSIFIIALSIFLVFFIWSSLLQGTKLPLTDQVVQQAFTNTYKESVEQDKAFPFWTSEHSGGFPLSLFESPFYYERNLISWIFFPDQSLTHHFNYYSFFNFVLLLVGIYCLARRLGWSKVASILTMVFFITSPIIASKCGYSGDMKELTSFAILPVMFIVFMLGLKKKKSSYFLLLALLVSTYYFTNLVPLIPSVIMFAFYYLFYKLINKELPTKKEIYWLGGLAVTIFVVLCFQIVPMFHMMGYASPSSWNFDLTVKQLFTDIIKPMYSKPILDRYTHNMGFGFFILGLGGMIWSLKSKIKSKESYLLLAFLFTIISFIIPGIELLLRTVQNQRIILLVLLIFSLFIGRLFDFVKNFSIYHVMLFAILLIVLIPNVNMTRTQTNAWVNEQAQNGLFQEQYAFLDQYGPGRAINYGVFAYATEPFIPVISNMWMITHTSIVAPRTIPQYELKDGSESGVNTDHTITYVLNRMRTTFTRYIIIVKDPGRKGDIAHNIISQEIEPLFDSEQLSMFIVPNSTYIHSVVPVRTVLSREEIYSEPEGWKVFVLNSSEVVLKSVEQIAELPNPINYDFKTNGRGKIDIYGDFNGEWIVVKDHYFPTWRAYMNGKELEIKENNLGTLLVKTEKGNVIHMTHKLFWYDPILAIISAIALFGVFLYPIFSKE